MSKTAQKTTIKIDGKLLSVEKGATVLEAAEKNGIYIPTLCTHKELSPFGACRMCVVEVDGMRGYPAACTTPVSEGMEVKTNSKGVHAARVDVLQLILSEHPSSCLICGEKDDCRSKQGTVRKAGVTTGCRYCPSDSQCELQDVAEYLGVKELAYPIRYRGIPVAKGDPFIDRDYNLCILCGRCVRVCGELRGSAALAFLNRGPDTIVGTAFDCDQIDADCEFCGECISVCPTGALSERVKKWDGAADKEEVTTCPLCGVGCQLNLLAKDNEVIGALPVEDEVVSDAQLCVKGRFCLPELVNDERRLVEPFALKDGGALECSWDDAAERAAEKLAGCGGGDFGMVVSANCSSEDLYIAQKFARVAMGSDNIDTDARRFFGPDYGAYIELMKIPGALTDIKNSQVIFAVGLDVRFAQSVANVEIRKAADKGARIITLNPYEHNLSVSSDIWLKPQPGAEVRFVEKFLGTVVDVEEKPDGETDISDESMTAAAAMLRGSENPIILVGTELLRRDTTQGMLGAIKQLAEAIEAKVVVLPPQNNLYGSLLMGAHTGLLPGAVSAGDKKQLKKLGKTWGADLGSLDPRPDSGVFPTGQKTKVLYLVGDVPGEERPQTDFLIYQNMYPMSNGLAADLLLPSAAFSEEDGTFVNGEGRVQVVRKVVDPPGDALPDWDILCRIAKKMGKPGFDFKNVAEIQKEISGLVAAYGDVDKARFDVVPLETDSGAVEIQNGANAAEVSTEHTYKGFAIREFVGGAEDLFEDSAVDANTRKSDV